MTAEEYICEHGRSRPPSGDDYVEIGHAETVPIPKNETREEAEERRKRSEWVERVKYKDWTWRCKGCFPVGTRNENSTAASKSN